MAMGGAGVYDLEPWLSRPWEVDGKFDNDIYRLAMTQHVLDMIWFVGEQPTLDALTRARVGSNHVSYAAGVLGVPIRVEYSGLYSCMTLPGDE
jgi:hypothetical protein